MTKSIPSLEKIGLWYEKLPANLKKHFDKLDFKKNRHVQITGKDEIDFLYFVSNHSSIVNKQVVQDFVKLFSDYKVFENEGKKLITITSDKLKEELFNTAIDKMTINDLHLPFKIFFVKLDIKFTESLIGNQKIVIDGAYIREHENLIHVISMETHNSMGIPAMTYFDIYKDIPIINQISRIAKSMQASYPDALKTDIMNQYDIHLVSSISKLFSILFYMDYAQKEEKETIQEKNEWKPYTKPKKTSKKVNKVNIKKLKSYHNFNLCSNPSIRATGSNIMSHKQTKITLVRGHWRNQAHGPKNDKKHKLIWIKPFWKNLDQEKNKELHVYKINTSKR